MNTRTQSADGYITVLPDDNHTMTEPVTSPLRRVAEAPFTRRARRELGYTLDSFWLAVLSVAFIIPMLANGLLWGLSTDGVRRLGSGARVLARACLDEDIPAPPPIQPLRRTKVSEPGRRRVPGLGFQARGHAEAARPGRDQRPSRRGGHRDH